MQVNFNVRNELAKTIERTIFLIPICFLFLHHRDEARGTKFNVFFSLEMLKWNVMRKNGWQLAVVSCFNRLDNAVEFNFSFGIAA